MSKALTTIALADLDFREGLPFARRYQDIYFSAEDPLAEKRAVFIDGSNLPARFAAAEGDFHIAEMGFGAGLNFLLSWACFDAHAQQAARLVFITAELEPLSKADLMRCQALWPELAKYAAELAAQYPVLTPGKHWLSFAKGRVQLLLMLGDALDSYRDLLICGGLPLEQQLRPKAVDAWFLDGFSPAKNSDLWSLDLCKTIAALSAPGTSLTTYTAAGEVKRNLQAQGFVMQRIKGFGKKRQRLSGEFAGQPTLSTKGKTPWHWNARPTNSGKRVLILGAGLAGAFTARALAKRGYRVQVLDKRAPAAGASGIAQGVLFPHLSAFGSALGQFMLTAYGFALQSYRSLLAEADLGALQGAAYLLDEQDGQSLREEELAFFARYPELAQPMSAEALSELVGIPLQRAGLFMPEAGYLHVPELCQHLLQAPNIRFAVQEAEQLQYADGLWQIGEFAAEYLVLANGIGATAFAETSTLPLKPIRGQCTQMAATAASERLRIPLCGEAYILPAQGGRHWLGSTYQLQRRDTDCCLEDDVENCAKLSRLSQAMDWGQDCLAQYAGIRASCPDYLPLVGAVPKAQEFAERFARFAYDANAWIPEPGLYYPGLYIIAGFGSRGLSSIPLAAEYLAAEIHQEFPLLGRALSQALSPARFLKRALGRRR